VFRRVLALLLLIYAAQTLAEEALPDGWKHAKFPSISTTTVYAFVQSGSTYVIEAHAKSSASFLVRRVTDAGDRLHWKWRVDRTILPGDGLTKETDDFPARVWVGFEGSWEDAGWGESREAAKMKEQYGFDPPRDWIHYVWTGRNHQTGDVFPEPYRPEHFKCVALRTVSDPLQTWFDEERDPRADFKKAFGRDPGKIIAVAVMTDGDDTGSEALAYYSEVGFVSSATR
jgi:hypothetical protein